MALYLDSASVDDARRAVDLGFVAGATTNPILVARSGQSAEQVIADLCEVLPGTVFHQVTQAPGLSLDDEIARFRAISDRVAFKLPCTFDYLKAVHVLSEQDVVCAVTAVFSPAQVYLAAEAGARHVIPYVNRTTRLVGDGPALVAQMAALLADSDCEILAASIKSPEEAVESRLAGAHHLTLAWEVLTLMAQHRLTEEAIVEFAEAAGKSVP